MSPTTPRFERLSKVHRRFENPHVEMVFHRNFRNVFRHYLKNPAKLREDAAEMLSDSHVRRTDVFRGTATDDLGRKHELVVKIVSPQGARNEFENYYRLLTGKPLFLSKKPGQLLLQGSHNLQPSKPGVERPQILVPQPIGYVIDKAKNEGFLITRYVPGQTLEQVNLDALPRKKRKQIIYGAAKLHRGLIQRGVIHADLRPRNFLVHEEGDKPKVYLLDPEFSTFVPVFSEDHRIFDFKVLQQALASQGGKWEDMVHYKITPGDMRRYFRTLFPTPEERKRFIGSLRAYFPKKR